MSHPADISSFTASMCPFLAAIQSGVCPPLGERVRGVVVSGERVWWIYVYMHNASYVFSSDIVLLHKSNANNN